MGCSSPGSHLSSSVGASELSHRQRVIIRLQDIGYTPTEALVRTDSMTQDELSYFADNPEAIKRSGVVVALFLLLSSTFVAANEGAKKGAKKETEVKEVHIHHYDKKE